VTESENVSEELNPRSGGEGANHDKVSNSHSTIWNHISKIIHLGLGD